MSSRSEKEKQKQVQDKCQVILGQLLREEDNKYCVDCDAKGPRWASWNLGIFVCIRCAGIHRNLGVHISRVKSVNLDTWTPEQVACLQQMGNSKARAVYEAYLPDNFRRPQTDSTLEAFVRAKYETKKYIAKEWVPLPVPKPAFDIDEDHKKDRKKKQNRLKNLPNVEIPPPQQAAALPRPHGAPLTSGNSPVASSKADSQKPVPSPNSQPSVDLLGLDVPPPSTTDQSGEDLFDAFMSAAPLPTTTSASSQNGFPVQQAATATPPTSQGSTFNEPPSASEKKTVMSKESILSLYSTASNSTPQQPMYGIPGGMYIPQGMYVQPQQMAQMPQMPQIPQMPQMPWPSLNSGAMVDPNLAQATMQNPNVAQVQHQMAALQLVSQQWQTGAAVPAGMASYPTVQPATIPSRPNMQGHTLANNL